MSDHFFKQFAVRWRHGRFQTWLITACVFIIGAACLTAGFYTTSLQSQALMSNLERQVGILAENLAVTSADAIRNRRIKTNYSLHRASQFPGIIDIDILDRTGKTVIYKNKPGIRKNNYANIIGKQDTGVYKLSQKTPIIYARNDKKILFQPVWDGNHLGWLRITYDLSGIPGFQFPQWGPMLGIAMGLTILTYVLFWSLILPQTQLSKKSGAVSNTAETNRERLGEGYGHLDIQPANQDEITVHDPGESSRKSSRLLDLVFTMDKAKHLLYLNTAISQKLEDLEIKPDDLCRILPPDYEVFLTKCIEDKEIFENLEVGHANRQFTWSFFPGKDDPVIHGHGAEIIRKDDEYPKTRSASSIITDLYEQRKNTERVYPISRHPDYRRQRGTILIVEDDPTMQDNMTRYLIKEGFRVTSARDGETGLELAMEIKPDLITLDIMIPNKNGWMVLSSIKDIPALANTPIVVVSDVGNSQFVHAMGADDFIPKPVNWKKLGNTIKELIRRVA